MINKIKEYFYKKNKKKKLFAFVKVFGCQQNEADAEKIKGFLSSIGFEFVDDPILADFILFETCAVRHTAENRVLGQIGALKNIKIANPNVFISICGCMVEQEEVRSYISEKFPFVDLMCGAKLIDYFPNLLYEKLTGEKLESFCSMPVLRDNKFKAWIPIISGCNNFCSYCIVPYVRGREKSRNYEEILRDCKLAIDSGAKVLTFLGQNVNSYEYENIKFSDLIKMVDNINADFVFRFMTSHPKDFNKDLIDILADCKHFSGNIHLPVQSGNNRILKLMNRKYTREDYIEKVNYAKSKIKNLVLTSDIIVGFPGETNEEFEDTVSLIKDVKFYSIFNFIYSPRSGTLSYKMTDDISHEEKAQRISKLINIQNEISEQLFKDLIGKKFDVMIEKISDGEILSKTRSNLLVKIKNTNLEIGKIVKVKIISSSRNYLVGELEEKDE